MDIYKLMTTLYSTTSSCINENDSNGNILSTYLSATTTSTLTDGWKSDARKIIENSRIIDSMSEEQLAEFEEKLNIKEHEFEVSLDEKEPKVYVKSDKNERLF